MSVEKYEKNEQIKKFDLSVEKEVSDAIIKVDAYMNLIGTMKAPLHLCSF